MSNPQYIYAGPSWAVSSFPDTNKDRTNLSIEWGIPCISVAKHGSSVLSQIDCVKEALDKTKLPVIWIYNEPIGNLMDMVGLSIDNLVQDENWKELHRKCNQACLEKINDLGVPVLLIGGHHDIIDCNYENITIGHNSWQKWLAEQSGMLVIDGIIDVTPADGGTYKLEHCWGAEEIHRFIHETPSVKPVPDLVDAIWDIYYFWDELQKRDWFFEVHPNKRGNVEFAKFLKPVVDNFLEENKNG